MLAKNIYCSLTIQYMTSMRTVFLSPMISGAFWRYTQSHDIHAYILYIYIHTFIYVIIVFILREPGLYYVDVQHRFRPETRVTERGKRARRREFRTFLPDLSVAFAYFVNTKISV